MTLLLSLFLLIYQASGLPAAKLSAVDFSAVKQGKVEYDQGCLPLHVRQITFRVRNRSDRAIYIYGLKTDRYYPLGYLTRLDGENRWLNPRGDALHLPYKEFMARAPVSYEPDVYVLKPGGSMTFINMAVEADLGGRLKRVIYVSLGRDEEPRLMTSEEFILR